MSATDESRDLRDVVNFQVVERLEELLQVALFATGADLSKRGGLVPRTDPTVDSIAVTTQPTTLLAANGYRKGATVYNDSPSPLVLYVKFGPDAGPEDFTVKLQQDDYYEVPANYRGEISGVWSDTGSGAARVTEYAW